MTRCCELLSTFEATDSDGSRSCHQAASESEVRSSFGKERSLYPSSVVLIAGIRNRAPAEPRPSSPRKLVPGAPRHREVIAKVLLLLGHDLLQVLHEVLPAGVRTLSLPGAGVGKSRAGFQHLDLAGLRLIGDLLLQFLTVRPQGLDLLAQPVHVFRQFTHWCPPSVLISRTAISKFRQVEEPCSPLHLAAMRHRDRKSTRLNSSHLG